MSELIDVLRLAFLDWEFNASDVKGKAEGGNPCTAPMRNDPELDAALAAALDATIPDVRYRSGYYRDQFKVKAIRKELRNMKRKGLLVATDRKPYWHFRIANGA